MIGGDNDVGAVQVVHDVPHESGDFVDGLADRGESAVFIARVGRLIDDVVIDVDDLLPFQEGTSGVLLHGH